MHGKQLLSQRTRELCTTGVNLASSQVKQELEGKEGKAEESALLDQALAKKNVKSIQDEAISSSSSPSSSSSQSGSSFAPKCRTDFISLMDSKKSPRTCWEVASVESPHFSTYSTYSTYSTVYSFFIFCYLSLLSSSSSNAPFLLFFLLGFSFLCVLHFLLRSWRLKY